MGVVSLVLGIIAVITGWIPFICFLALILAIIGLILGIVDTAKKSKVNDSKRGISIAGLIVSALAIPVIIFTSLVTIGIFAAIVSEDYVDYQYYDWYDDYYDDYYDYDWYRYYYNTIDYETDYQSI